MREPLRVHKRDAETIWNKRWRMEHLYPIRTEDRKLRYIRLKDRQIQEDLFSIAEKQGFRGLRLINLKSRKLGVTTFWSLFYLDDTIITPNTTTCIIAHTKDDVQKIFQIIKTAYAYAPKRVRLHSGKEWRKPEAKYDNKNELVFDGINSKIFVALQSRGETINNLHITEAAHIENAEERMAATLEAVPSRELGTNITIETTANGVGGWFHDYWYKAVAKLNEFQALFFPWFSVTKNRLTPPSDYAPSQAILEHAEKVKKECGVILDKEQMFWWDMKRAGLDRLMNQENPGFPDDAFLATGMVVFSETVLKNIKTKDPIRTTLNGTRIFVEPKQGRRYIVGADVAEGVGGDRSVAEVIDAITLEQVAEFVSDAIKPADFGSVLAEIGKQYNNALIAVERNNHGHTVIEKLRHIYTHLFEMVSFDEKRNKKTRKLGWLTRGHTRDLMLDKIVELTDDETITVNSAILKSEMLTFVTNEDGKREAKSGSHDDTIMAAAIAIFIACMPKASYAVYDLND
jgi:hypothetical protein